MERILLIEQLFTYSTSNLSAKMYVARAIQRRAQILFLALLGDVNPSFIRNWLPPGPYLGSSNVAGRIVFDFAHQYSPKNFWMSASDIDGLQPSPKRRRWPPETVL
jgi:hypothetical protein